MEKQKNQVNSLLYVMGDKSDDILSTLTLTDQQKAVYADVKKAFDEHFVGRHNVIYERAKFNSRQQQKGESAENFITAVHKLAEHCRFGDLKEEMIRDRIVVGIRNSRLSERLQLDPDLTLARTITQVRQQEDVKKQQQLLRGEHSEIKGANVDAMNTGRWKKPYRQTPPLRPEHSMSKPNFVNKTSLAEKCKRCGKTPQHPWKMCPAKEAECRKCRKKGHFAAVCRSSQRVEAIVDSDAENDIAFMGAVNAEEKDEVWLKEISMNGEQIMFKLDSGASVTAIPASMYSRKWDGRLMKPPKRIKGPDNSPLQVLGMVRSHIKTERKETMQNVYVIENLVTPLMGLPALIKLNLIQQVASVQAETQKNSHQYKAIFPKVFSGLGKLQGSYKIKCALSPTQGPITHEGPSQRRAGQDGNIRGYKKD
ncbi:uncharacterized protein LOC133418443 isoform X1 [Cololabis saira]|uniref:uncharacterized protein LOC133418443 isoform X1 n=1 Tax=Cololabis saira TaxID=129043 RepID=UPI002AD241C0|nr:uncharacterized protein LOC133418443 isoform X1 [Cololabis saira]